MAEAKTLAAHVAELDFATKTPKDEDDIGKGLHVKLVIEVELMSPEEIETLAYMKRDGHTRLTLLQEQLPMFGKGGETV